MRQRDLIEVALLAPDLLSTLTELQWDLLLRQGRRANLLARLAQLVDDRGLLSTVPSAPRQHLISARRIALRQGIAVRWEVECIRNALADTDIRIVLLKGAAYLLAGLPVAQGRVFSDVDILVPRHAMANVESALMLHGWHSADSTEYDQRYYRRWMHEIPPMRHVRRGTTIDVHHAILPLTARVKVDTVALYDGLIPLPGQTNIFVLKPTDMVLHSATHLFHEGELENGLRDLFDLDSLMRHFSATDLRFWDELIPRALELGLVRPLYYAIKFTIAILDTPVPRHVIEAVKIGKPPMIIDQLMEFCYRRALKPLHASCDQRWTRLARVILYVRSHWIRMPSHLLAYHLIRKAVVRSKSLEEKKLFIVDDDRSTHANSEISH